MTQLQAIVFDLDGTLIHSAPDIQYAANEMLRARGRSALDLPTIISFIGNGVETLVRKTLDATGGATDAGREAALHEFLEIYDQNMTTRTHPYPGVIAALNDFKQQGLRLGICTNKVQKPAQEICDALALSPFFDVIIGAVPGRPKKPDPASLYAAINALGVPRETAIYVGDSEIDYATAHNASVDFRLFSGGYLNTPLPDLATKDRFDDWIDHGIMASNSAN